MSTPNVLLPQRPRLIVYLIPASITGVIIPAAALWFTSAGEPVPSWLVRVAAVASFVVAAPLVVAALNINRDDSNLYDQGGALPSGLSVVTNPAPAHAVTAPPAPEQPSAPADVPAKPVVASGGDSAPVIESDDDVIEPDPTVEK